MSQQNPGKCLSLRAGAATITAGMVVAVSGAKAVAVWATQTSNILGVALDTANPSAGVAVILDGTARVICFASVSVGAIVGPATDGSGKIVERGNPATATTAEMKTLGIALESGSTDGTIEVALMVDNRATHTA